MELVNCLNKYSMNTAFKKQSQEAQQLLEVCAQRLKDQPSLLNHFINKLGN